MVTAIILFAVFSLLPINLFNGEIVYYVGNEKVIEPRPLSLSYFFGLGYEDAEMDVIEDFYLTPQGWMMAFIFILGIPGIIAYRIYLRNVANSE